MIIRLPIRGIGFVIVTRWGGLVVIIRPKLFVQWRGMDEKLIPPPWMRFRV